MTAGITILGAMKPGYEKVLTPEAIAFAAELASLGGFLIAAATLGAILLAAYHLTRARKMVQQYPWLYERRGPFGWRER